MARTMSDGREELIREVVAESVLRAESGGTLYAAPLVAELDAERAAHEATKRDYASDFALLRAEQAKIAALKARLALAEAVCEAFDDYRRSEGGAFSFQNTFDAHDKWRAAK